MKIVKSDLSHPRSPSGTVPVRFAAKKPQTPCLFRLRSPSCLLPVRFAVRKIVKSDLSYPRSLPVTLLVRFAVMKPQTPCLFRLRSPSCLPPVRFAVMKIVKSDLSHPRSLPGTVPVRFAAWEMHVGGPSDRKKAVFVMDGSELCFFCSVFDTVRHLSGHFNDGRFRQRQDCSCF